MRIAIVGSGISGLTSAWLFSRPYEVTLLEASDYLGGNTHTHDLELHVSRYAINSGFRHDYCPKLVPHLSPTCL